MKRIAAILIAITLLFSAGSALADYTASDNKLFVEAMQLSLSAEDEESPAEVTNAAPSAPPFQTTA